eukprot:GFKZ01014359.1.p2 GENE.GFKZ01014359.1~~GFKZ01014359.1.p2  ORF type:complete len:104 (-),score=7.63 GFKZ01014359.1:39-350(-)
MSAGSDACTGGSSFVKYLRKSLNAIGACLRVSCKAQMQSANERGVRIGGGDNGEGTREAAHGEGFPQGAGVEKGAFVTRYGDLSVLLGAMVEDAGADAADAPL